MQSSILSFLLLAVAMTTAVGQVPRTVSFQGRARDAAGSYPNDTRRITIRIYDALTAGTALFSETHSVKLDRGAFTVIIGGITSGGIPDDVSFDRQLWLDITIESFNGNLPLSPRLRFGSAPSALNAQIADVANGLTSGATIDVRSLAPSDTAGSDAAPDVGSLYRDNVPMAWGLVDADGSIISDFGIRSVTRNSRGQYVVVLDNAAAMMSTPKGLNVPALAPVVQPSVLTDVTSPLTAQWFFAAPGTPDADRAIFVRTFAVPNGSAVVADLAFSIIIFGRPAN